jgi:prepilin-type N-terminal cleavage/methylation domain-containing protein
MPQTSSHPVPVSACFLTAVKSRQGFTLLELIIVCVLITISLAFSLPSFRQALVIDQLAASSRKVIALIREVRLLAAQEQQPYLIHFDLDRKKIWYQPDIPGSEKEKQQINPWPGIEFPAPIRLQDIQTATTEKKQGGAVALWINKQGYMEQTILHLADDQNNIISLVISPFLSTIKAHDTYINLE